jgi:hypothetical protein
MIVDIKNVHAQKNYENDGSMDFEFDLNTDDQKEVRTDPVLEADVQPQDNGDLYST